MENEQYIESGLSVGTTKIANKYEIFTEEEVNIINNKIPELDGRVSIIEYEIEEINSSLDNMESLKATKQEVELERKRIDNLATLEEGSTTGDAELIDGRIGANNILYDNLGNAIRSQFEDVNSILFTNVETNLKLVSGYVSSSDGVFIPTEDGIIACSSKIKTKNIVELKNIYFEKEILFKVCFYNEDGTFIKATNYEKFVNYVLDKNKIAICVFKFSDNTKILDVDFLRTSYIVSKHSDNVSINRIDTTYNLLSKLTLYDKKNVKLWKDLIDYNIDSVLTDSTLAYCYSPLQIRNGNGLIYGDKLYLTILNNSNGPQITFYNIDGHYISSIHGTTGGPCIKNAEISIPTNAWYMIVIGYHSLCNPEEFELTIPKINSDWLDLDTSIPNNSITAKHINGEHNLLKNLTIYDNKNVKVGGNLSNLSVEPILIDSEYAYCYSPLQVRNESGLIYDTLHLSTWAGGKARQVMLYDKFGGNIGLLSETNNTIKEKIVELGDAWYIVVIGYYNYEKADTFCLHEPKKKIEWLDIDIKSSKIESTTRGLYSEKPTIDGKSITELIDVYKYPLLPSWGHEYLYSWYEKLFNNENVVISVDGDSTTEENAPIWKNVEGRRVDMIKKIMCTIGKYPTEKITINKNGYGSRTTGTWVGAYFNSDIPSDATNFPNGILDKTMAQNPDLIIFGFGINDASINLFPNTSIEYRINQSKEWLEEGLKRIRGNETVNGRPSYNKSADELSIIICTPIQAENGKGRGRDIWQQYQRIIFMELARKYNCAFYDVSARHYDHKFSGQWSNSNVTSNRSYDFIHPMPACNADFMSGMQDLLFPICLWKW